MVICRWKKGPFAKVPLGRFSPVATSMWVSWFGCRVIAESLEKLKIGDPGPPECSPPMWFRTSPEIVMMPFTEVEVGLVKPMSKAKLGVEKDRQDIWMLLATPCALE